METRTNASTALESLLMLDRVIPLAAGGPAVSLRLETDRLVIETADRSLALGLWPGIDAFRRGASGAWLPTERWADALLAAWPRLEPGSLPARDPFSALRRGRRPARAGSGTTGELWPFSIFLERIPAECRAAASRFSSRRWHLLGLFASDERFVELAGSNPGLAFALACAWRFRRLRTTEKTPGPPAGLSGWKRRKIASWLGFPGTESAVRTLGGIEPQGLTLPRLLRLRDRMDSGALASTLPRLDRIDAAVLGILAQPRLDAMASPDLLREIVVDPLGARHARMLERLRGLSRALGEKEPDAPIRSVRRLEAVYRERSERLRDRIWTKKSRSALRDFGEPPFPGKPGIEPIQTEAGLYREGLEMRNCVPYLATEVARGRKYFYKVDLPVRATLMVERPDDEARGSWAAGDVRGPENENLPALVAQQCFQALLASGASEYKQSGDVERPCCRQAELPW